jgi:hypothetical protein
VGTTYYITVRAQNTRGTVSASSNGVTPLGRGGPLPGGALVLHDGKGCESVTNLLQDPLFAGTEGGAGVAIPEAGAGGLVLPVHVLQVGHRYTVRVSPPSLAAAAAGGGLALTVGSDGGTTTVTFAAATGKAEFTAVDVATQLTVGTTGTAGAATATRIEVLECFSDRKAQRETDQVAVWWTQPAAATAAQKDAAHVHGFVGSFTLPRLHVVGGTHLLRLSPFLPLTSRS